MNILPFRPILDPTDKCFHQNRSWVRKAVCQHVIYNEHTAFYADSPPTRLVLSSESVVSPLAFFFFRSTFLRSRFKLIMVKRNRIPPSKYIPGYKMYRAAEKYRQILLTDNKSDFYTWWLKSIGRYYWPIINWISI